MAAFHPAEPSDDEHDDERSKLFLPLGIGSMTCDALA
jgi:hypothetical protein